MDTPLKRARGTPLSAECRALTRLRGARGPEEANLRGRARQNGYKRHRTTGRDGRTWTRRTATSSGTSSASTRCCMRTRAPRGRRAAKSGGSEDESGQQGRTQKRTRGRRGARIEVIDLGEVDGLGIEDKDVLRTLRELATSHSTFAEAYAGASPAPSTCPRPGRHAQARALRLYLDAARLALLGIDGAYSGTAEGALTDDLSSYPSAPRALYELLRHLIREDFCASSTSRASCPTSRSASSPRRAACAARTAASLRRRRSSYA